MLLTDELLRQLDSELDALLLGAAARPRRGARGKEGSVRDERAEHSGSRPLERSIGVDECICEQLLATAQLIRGCEKRSLVHAKRCELRMRALRADDTR